jgi:hypothetical protein
MSIRKNITNVSSDTGKGNPIIISKEEILSRKYFLKEKIIGISISESDNLNELGYGAVHLKDAMIEVARYIVASGGRIAYGGDMRLGGFTELMFDLLAYYKADKTLSPHERFYSYLAYPISATLSSEKEAELRQNVSFKKVLPPKDITVANTKDFLNPDSPENLYVWARCLTKMREEMESECHARIFIGGRTKGYKGKCPGILEELLIALANKRPVYLVGAFGGITRHAIDALSGKQSASFYNDYHTKDLNYGKMLAIYNKRQPDKAIDYSIYYSILKETGISGISALNGLKEEENLRLATTHHISEVVFLILKGLNNCFIN